MELSPWSKYIKILFQQSTRQFHNIAWTIIAWTLYQVDPRCSCENSTMVVHQIQCSKPNNKPDERSRDPPWSTPTANVGTEYWRLYRRSRNCPNLSFLDVGHCMALRWDYRAEVFHRVAFFTRSRDKKGWFMSMCQGAGLSTVYLLYMIYDIYICIYIHIIYICNYILCIIWYNTNVYNRIHILIIQPQMFVP